MSVDRFDFVLSSETRLKVISFLGKNSCTPTQLAKEIEKHLSHISRALRELESRDLVACATPTNSKPRVYQLTTNGIEVLNEIRYRVRIGVM